jgi:hypothetical protein
MYFDAETNLSYGLAISLIMNFKKNKNKKIVMPKPTL